MGGRHSKRSVDISGNQGGMVTAADEQPLDGRLERIEEGAKIAQNGSSHSETSKADDLDRVPNGDPTNPSSPMEAEPEGAGPSTPPMASPTAEVGAEVAQEVIEPEVPQPPKKKDKVKKKWSFRSISFSKKDKSKPAKEEGAKEDPETLPEVPVEGGLEVVTVTVPEGVTKVAEEKAEKASGFMSSLTGAFSGAAKGVSDAADDAVKSAGEAVKDAGESVQSAGESAGAAVSEAVVAAGDMADEKCASTQENIEKVSAKVAEKAEALVVKMEALTVKTVDAAKEMVGIGESEAAKAGSEIAEAAKMELDAAQTALPEAAGKIATAVEEMSVVTDSDEGDVVLLSANFPVAREVEIATENFVAKVEEISKKVEEIPPPLPASPPPSETIADVVSDLVEKVSSVQEMNVVANAAEKIAKVLDMTTPESSMAPQSPVVISEVVAECEVGEGDKAAVAPTAETISTSAKFYQLPDAPLDAEVLSQGFEPSDKSLEILDSKEEIIQIIEPVSGTIDTSVGEASEEPDQTPDDSTEPKNAAEE